MNTARLQFQLNKANLRLPEMVIKRNGSTVPFDANRIERAISQCYANEGLEIIWSADDVTQRVAQVVASKFRGETPTVEQVQDTVELTLLTMGEYAAAQAYIRYRDERTRSRGKRAVPDDVKAAFDEDKQYFQTPEQQFMFYEKYSRFSWELNRRETWHETVDRTVDHLRWEISEHGTELTDTITEMLDRVREGILKMRVAPSMRLLAMAGDAARRNSMSLYNCSYLPINSIDSFVETMLISMAGCVSGDTIISTVDGPRRIADLENTPFYALVDGKSHYAPHGSFQTGVKQLYRLETIDGRTVELTEDHPLLTAAGWKRAGDLAIGEQVKLATQSLGDWKGVGTAEEGYLLGLFTGDGSFRRRQTHLLAVHNGDPGSVSVMNHAFSCHETVRDERKRTGQAGRGQACSWTSHRGFSGLALGSWANDLGFTYDAMVPVENQYLAKPGKLIPHKVETYSSDFQREFLRGFFDADGSVHYAGRWIRLVQVPRANLVLVQRMLARFGVTSTIRKKRNAGQMTMPGGRICQTQDIWQLSITGTALQQFHAQIGFGHSEKQQKLENGVAAAKWFRRSKEWDEISSIEATRIDAVWDTHIEDVLCFDGNGLLLHNCGVGFSVERDYVEQFPRVARQTGEQLPTHIIVDTTEGWGDALRTGLETWWSGRDVDFDASTIRPAGSVLKTKGGRASGPEPLTAMLAAARSIILARQGTFIRTTDAHMLECWVGEAAVQGGVRRTAMISLFDWDDREMRTVKDGTPPDFAMTPTGQSVLWNANNSAVWPEDVTELDVMRQLLDMAEARSGEPGIFSRANAIRSLPARRKPAKFGTNPCGEIILRPFEFCNLSQAIARPGDTERDLYDKVELATVIGVIQSLSTRFPGLRPEWQQNCQEERLLGVDLTAQADCELLQNDDPAGQTLRKKLAAWSVQVSNEWSRIFGINAPVSNTCNKPAGNSAEFYNAANGIHRRKAHFYKRRYTVGTHSPIFRVLMDAGAPLEPRYGSTAENATQWILTIPKKSPDGALVIAGATAVDQCNFWLLNKVHWTEHNPSCTITYREAEFADLVKWIVDHKDQIGGLSFFPASDAIYKQAPFEEIDEDEFINLAINFPQVDYSTIYAYEIEDMTTAAQELACFAGDGSCAL